MGRHRWVLVLCLAVGGIACSESVGELTCVNNVDCSEGHACGPEGTCHQIEALNMDARVLEPAYLHEPYAGVTMQGRGGIPDYVWRLESRTAGALDWLEIDEATGELNNAEGDYPVATGEFRLDIYIRDQSNYGQGKEISRTFSIIVNESRCGPNPCPDGKVCCSSRCVDVSSSWDHCGTCQHSCATMINVAGARCENGGCVFSQCADQFLDCDGDPFTGCETPSTLSNCGGCGDACDDPELYAHTENPYCTGGRCGFDCLLGFADCDQDTTNGCESALITPVSCGECGTSCIDHPLGGACLAQEDGQHGCGCLTQADCPLNRLCCGKECVERNAEHCQGCGSPCTNDLGGTECVDLSDTSQGPWECRCNRDLDCQGGNPGSAATCGETDGQCTCGPNGPCVGSVDDLCCGAPGSEGCVDLFSDASHCGVCDAECGPGDSCLEGACTCSGVPACPQGSGATACLGGQCVCLAYDEQPCPIGQYCCQGSMEIATGCCLVPCDEEVGNRKICSNGCNPPKVWCEHGCCDSCDPDQVGTCVGLEIPLDHE